MEQDVLAPTAYELSFPRPNRKGRSSKNPSAYDKLIKKNKKKKAEGATSYCKCCGIQTFEITVDHIIPRVFGGSHRKENLTLLCISCNQKKGNKISKPIWEKMDADQRHVFRTWCYFELSESLAVRNYKNKGEKNLDLYLIDVIDSIPFAELVDYMSASVALRNAI